MEHVSGKTKEYLQPNPGTVFTDNTFLLFILFLLTIYASIASSIIILNDVIVLLLKLPGPS